MSWEKKTFIFICSILLGSALYFVLLFFAVKLEAPVLKNAEIWIRDVYIAKQEINNKPTNKNRIFIIGDSNVLFGFNGAMIEANTNYAFINYGTSQGLPANYHFDKIMQHAKDEDIVFLSFGFEVFRATMPYENIWYVQNMLTWDKNYKKFITQQNTIKAYLYNNPIITLRSIAKLAIQTLNAKQLNAANILSHIAIQDNVSSRISHAQNDIQFIPCQAQTFNGYHYKSLSPTGDFCSQSGSLVLDRAEAYLDTNLQVSQFFLDEYARLQEFADIHNIKLFLIYPPTMENTFFSLNDKETFAKIENLNTQLSKYNIHFVGDFRDFHFERKYFYDAAYHLNSEGVTLRTTNFIKLLRELEKNGEIP